MNEIQRLNEELRQVKQAWDASFDAGKEDKALRQKVFSLADELKNLLLKEEASKSVVDLNAYRSVR